VLCGLFAVLGTRLEVTTDSLKTVGRRVPYVANAYDVSEGLGSLYAYDVSITLPEAGQARDPERLLALDALATEVETAPNVKRTSSLTWVVKHLNRALEGDDTSRYAVPEDSATLERILLMYEMTVGDDERTWVDAEYRTLRLNVELERFSTAEMVSHVRTVEQHARELFPDAAVHLTGVAVRLALVVDYIVSGQILSVLVALAAICVVLMLALGSVRVGLVAMIPNVVPLVFVIGTMGALDIPLHQATAVIAPMLLGIAVDDTIHYITHLKAAFGRTGNYDEASRETFRHVGKAIIITSVVLAAGFAVLLTSVANAYRHVALVTIIGVITALAADLLVTPTLARGLRIFGPERTTSGKAAGSGTGADGFLQGTGSLDRSRPRARSGVHQP
jgi:predicted RND superfamily exporter protein